MTSWNILLQLKKNLNIITINKIIINYSPINVLAVKFTFIKNEKKLNFILKSLLFRYKIFVGLTIYKNLFNSKKIY